MPDADVEFFRSLEQTLHRPEVRSSRDAVGALLADSFREIGSSGRVYDKAMIVTALAQEALDMQAPLPVIVDFAAQALAPGLVLVTYRSVRPSRGQVPEQAALRSSIWQQVEGSWLMLFHQGTPALSRP